MPKKNLWKPLKLKPTAVSDSSSGTTPVVHASVHPEPVQRVRTSRDVERALNATQSVGSSSSGVYILSRARYSQSEAVLEGDDPASTPTSQQASPGGTPSPRSLSPIYGSPSKVPGFSSDYPEPPQLPPLEGHYRSSRANQWIKWTQIVIPSLIQPYLALTRRTDNLGAVDRTYVSMCTCNQSNARALTVTCVHFDCEYIIQCGAMPS